MEALTDLDGKLWRTLRGVAVNPGQVARDYVEGKRAHFVNPVRLFLVLFAVLIAVLAVTGNLDSFISQNVDQSGGALAGTEEALAEAIRDVLRNQQSLAALLALPIFALVLRWQFFRAKRNYVEILCFVLFVTVQFSLFMIVLVLAQYSLDLFINDVGLVLWLLVLLRGVAVFFQLGLGKAILYGSLAFGVNLAINFGVVVALAFIKVLSGY